MRVHIVGICGTFMGSLALIARSAGHTVTGCDAQVYPPMSTQLQAQGIDLIEGYGAEQVALKPDLFIIGNVVTRGNPLMEAILSQNLPYVSGPQWLHDHVLRTQHVLAVSGTHGKTTTSSMLAFILEHAGLLPNFLIGGVPLDFGVSARFNSASQHFVIEADEYDTAFFDKRSKFLHYPARTAILNNLEFDHADIFDDLAAIERQFHHWVRTLPAEALVIHPEGEAAVDRVLARGLYSRSCRVSTPSGWHVQPLEGGQFAIWNGDTCLGAVDWKLQGAHNQRNALAALVAACDVGVAPEVAIEALCQFQGIKRRMEVRGTVRRITVYDDFAHHPTAIRTTLQGLRAQVGPQARILAVLDPHSNTMKEGVLAGQLHESVACADRVFCFYEHSGKHALHWDPQQVFGPRAVVRGQVDELVDEVASVTEPGDHILVMSNGGFGGFHERLLKALSATSTQTG